jgi:hypothetical protein
MAKTRRSEQELFEAAQVKHLRDEILADKKILANERDTLRIEVLKLQIEKKQEDIAKRLDWLAAFKERADAIAQGLRPGKAPKKPKTPKTLTRDVLAAALAALSQQERMDIIMSMQEADSNLLAANQ